jgi:hypothetical protein
MLSGSGKLAQPMLTDEVVAASGKKMRITRQIAAIALFAAAMGVTACTPQRALSPQPAAPSFANSVVSTADQVPLLFVVDGVRYPKDHVPTLSADQVSTVRVIKGHRALQQYGPDASYGVVVITTKQASAPRS